MPLFSAVGDNSFSAFKSCFLLLPVTRGSVFALLFIPEEIAERNKINTFWIENIIFSLNIKISKHKSLSLSLELKFNKSSLSPIWSLVFLFKNMK